jgi:hypothetical protein
VRSKAVSGKRRGLRALATRVRVARRGDSEEGRGWSAAARQELGERHFARGEDPGWDRVEGCGSVRLLQTGFDSGDRIGC